MTSPTDDSSDVRLLSSLQHGDRMAFETLFDRHRDQLRWLISLRIDPCLRRRIDPSDVIQETHLETLQRLDDFLSRNPMPFQLWLRKTAYQKLMQLRRTHMAAAKRDLRRELPDESSIAIVNSLVDDRQSPSQEVVRAEQRRLLMQVMRQLSETDQEVLLMRNVEGLSHHEISYLLDIEPAAVRKRYGRALLRLRELLLQNGLTGSIS